MDMGRGEERVRCTERVTWKLTLPYVKYIANGNLLYVSGNTNRGSVSTQRGGMGKDMGGSFKSEGICVYLWLIHVEVWQKTTKFCNAIILQLKNKLIKKEWRINEKNFLNFLMHIRKISLRTAVTFYIYRSYNII